MSSNNLEKTLIKSNYSTLSEPKHLPTMLKTIVITLYQFIFNNLPIILYGITTILLFSDQNLLAPNLTAIATEFDFDELERDKKLGGDIAVAFFSIGGSSIVCGWMSW